MSWVDGLIAAVGQLGGAAIQGGFKSNEARIAAEAGVSTAYIQGGSYVAGQGWDAVGAGYNPSVALSSAIAGKYQSQAALEKAKLDASSQRTNLIIGAALVAGLALIVFVIWKYR